MKKKIFCTFTIILLILTIFLPIKGLSNEKTGKLDINKSQLSFAAYSDTHVGSKYKYWSWQVANHLDKIGKDLVDNTNLLDFAIHLGDTIYHNTGEVNGVGLPWYRNQYKNNLKSYLISNVNLPFHCVLGNVDITDYELNPNDPHNLTKSIVDEFSMNNPVYAMMRDGILFLIVPELAYVHWTHPVEYEWIEYMTSSYPSATTIILSHQAIEDTTPADDSFAYRGKQDMDWWEKLFQKNPQIKMWIHGHNHYLGWYVSNQTNNKTMKKTWYFGHEMAFSAPYSQMDWGYYHEEDRIVIYNITSKGISTTTWENDGKGGHWVSEYINLFNVDTTYDPNAENWYSFPMFLQDNETQLTDMKLLSPDVTLQLVGTVPMELFYDSKFEAPKSKRDEIDELALGFGNDNKNNVFLTNPGIKVIGPTHLTFPEKYPVPDPKKIMEDGRSGQPYQWFPMGTICSAIPGKTYNFTMTACCKSGNGRFKMNVSCNDWGTKSQYSTLSGSESEVFSHTFGPDYETIYGSYKVPDNGNAWFLQGRLNFFDPVDYDVSLFSVKRKRDSNTTDNFNLLLNGCWYNHTGVLEENEIVNFAINPKLLSDKDGVMNFTAYIEGNRYGMVNLIYREPLFLGRNARFKVNNYTDNSFNISLTKTITKNSPVKMALWKSNIFRKHPILTELFSRFLFHGLSGKVIDFIFSNKLSEFKMFPFSASNIYENVEIISDDGSEIKNISKNGNIWLSCNCPENKERYVEIILNNC